MPYQFAYGPCFSCGRVFGFNPDLVPSIPIDPATGEAWTAAGVKQPVCGMCIARANADPRRPKGLPPLRAMPGAYEPGPA